MKKCIALSLALFGFMFISAAGNKSITISITNIDPVSGKLWVSLYNSEDGYENNKKPVKRTKVFVSGKKQSVIFKGLPEGEYAVKIIHDEDNNGEFDTNLIGMPKEGFGFSNNAKGKMGPPSYKKAKFLVNTNTAIYIKLMKL